MRSYIDGELKKYISDYIDQDPALSNYKRWMSEAKANMKKSLEYVESLSNLGLKQNPKFQHLLKNYQSEIWEPLEEALNFLIIARNWPTEDRLAIEEGANEIINTVFSKLTDAGLPFLEKRKPVFWSSQLGKEAAGAYATSSGVNGATDEMALHYHRLILVGLPDGSNNILFPLIKNFPSISKIWGKALSEAFTQELAPKDTVHVFFQDSMMVGNFFWDVELPIIRSKAAKIILHIFDPINKTWSNGIDLDSAQAESTILRRRALSETEVKSIGSPKGIDRKNVIVIDGEHLFKENYHTDKTLQSTASPKLVTIHQIRSITIKWKYETQRKKAARKAGLFADKKHTLAQIPSNAGEPSAADDNASASTPSATIKS